MNFEEPHSTERKSAMRFDKTMNLGQVLMAAGFILSGVCVWASANVRVAQIEWKQAATAKDLEDTKALMHEIAVNQKYLTAEVTRLSTLIGIDREKR